MKILGISSAAPGSMLVNKPPLQTVYAPTVPPTVNGPPAAPTLQSNGVAAPAPAPTAATATNQTTADTGVPTVPQAASNAIAPINLKPAPVYETPAPAPAPTGSVLPKLPPNLPPQP